MHDQSFHRALSISPNGSKSGAEPCERFETVPFPLYPQLCSRLSNNESKRKDLRAVSRKLKVTGAVRTLLPM
jgi:hypothetical protein